MQNAKCKMQNAKCKMQNAKCKIVKLTKLRTIKPLTMKRIFIMACAIFFCFLMINAQEMKLGEILDNYYKVNGIAKLETIQTIIMKGTLVQQDIMPLKIIKMRPNKYLMEFDVADITAYQAFDGTTAWMTTPWTGNPKPQLMPEDRAKTMINTADFDGLLVKWKAKGHSTEFAGMDSVEKVPVYKIKLTRKDGGIEYYFIDTKSYLLQKRISYRMMRGKEVQVENFFHDYKAVDGIMFPFTIDGSIDGQHYSSNQYDTIELNKTVDAKLFEMPAEK
jgi:hypothetical protein